MNVILPKTVSPYQAKINMKTKVDNLVKKLLTTQEKDLLLELQKITDTNIDAVTLTLLNEKLGLNATQIREFWDAYKAVIKQLEEEAENEERYAYDYIPHVEALKTNLGIDIVAWEKEDE